MNPRHASSLSFPQSFSTPSTPPSISSFILVSLSPPFSHTHYQSPCSVDFNMPTPSIFSRQKPARPPIVPTDTIVPLHFFDDQPIFRAIVLNFSFRFDDVLDPEKLRTSLTRLIECGTWKKLGARLRQSVRQETDLIYVITGLIRTI